MYAVTPLEGNKEKFSQKNEEYFYVFKSTATITAINS
jgi:hypothetical protein